MEVFNNPRANYDGSLIFDFLKSYICKYAVLNCRLINIQHSRKEKIWKIWEAICPHMALIVIYSFK